MSMLAEPRRKTQYTLVPKGKPLYEDESNFGTRMLQKMGWSQGKGLGANEDGNKDFIRVKYKSDANGLGFVDRDDGWTQHKSEFETLLKSLNNSIENSEEEQDIPDAGGFGFQNGNIKKEEPAVPKLSGESLEEKSKKSRVRVHYKKFTKGKDLSQYSAKDLANIFGKKSLHVSEEETQKVEEVEKEEVEKTSPFGIQMINTGTSIVDYFRNKKALLRNGQTKTGAERGNQNSSEHNALENEESISANPSSKEKRKRVKEAESAGTVFQTTDSNNAPDCSKSDEVPKIKKKKKNQNIDSNESEELITLDTKEGECNDEIVPKKKKNKTKNSDEKLSSENISDFSNLLESVEDNEVNEEVVKKSKKKKKNEITAHQVEAEPACVVEPAEDNKADEVVFEKKSKKKKKNLNEITSSQVRNESEEGTEKKSKKKTKRFDGNMAIEADSPKFTELTNEEVTHKKPKKKKKVSDELLFLEAGPAISKSKSQNSDLSFTEHGGNVGSITGQTLEHENVLNECNLKQKKKRKAKEEFVTANFISSTQETTTTEKTPANSEAPDKPKKRRTDKKQPAEPLQNTSETENLQIPPTVSENKISTTASFIFEISSFCAEVFRHVDIDGFVGSNLSEIVGYTLSEDMTLKIKSTRGDQERITDMWYNAIGKYKESQKEKLNGRRVRKTLRNAISKKKLFKVV